MKPEVEVAAREAENVWRSVIHRDLGDALDLPEFGASLPISEVYRGTSVAG